jgi:hypothetical protein
MTEPSPSASKAPRSPKLPNGWLVLGGSVLASFVWWMLSTPPKQPEPAPAPVSAPAPAEEVASAPEPAPAKPMTAPPKPPADKARDAPRITPAPESAPERPAAMPVLRVISNVAGADVFIDRTFAGKTPVETRDITAGSHQINVSAQGYDAMSRRVEVSADAPTEVTFSLKATALDTTVQVVHKHRLGSCEGRLSATPAGLAYMPTSGDDAFQASLAAVETFGVDYREKELRLKLKGGKNFTFTTKAANADSLVVFHRDVEQARKKLAGGA